MDFDIPAVWFPFNLKLYLIILWINCCSMGWSNLHLVEKSAPCSVKVCKSLQ